MIVSQREYMNKMGEIRDAKKALDELLRSIPSLEDALNARDHWETLTRADLAVARARYQINEIREELKHRRKIPLE